MGMSISSSPSDLGYLAAAVGANGSEDVQASIRDKLFIAASDPQGRADAAVAGSGRTVAECLSALVESGNPEDFEFVMNCAAGTGDVAMCAKSLLARQFADNADPGILSQIRQMAQSQIELMGNSFVLQAKAQPEMLLLAGTVLEGEVGDAAIPPSVKEAIREFDQSEWRPVWWIKQPPGADGVFSSDAIKKLKQGFDGIPAHAKVIPVKGDGSCLFRSSLAIHLGEERWVDKSVTKGEIFGKLIDLGWDAKIKGAIKVAYEDLCSFMPPSDEVAQAFDVDKLFDRTIANLDFTLYSPHGIGAIMEGVAQSDEAENALFFETLADIITQRFIDQSGINPVPYGCEDPGKFQGSRAWIARDGAHYDLLVTEGFFRDPSHPGLLMAGSEPPPGVCLKIF